MGGSRKRHPFDFARGGFYLAGVRWDQDGARGAKVENPQVSQVWLDMGHAAGVISRGRNRRGPILLGRMDSRGRLSPHEPGVVRGRSRFLTGPSDRFGMTK